MKEILFELILIIISKKDFWKQDFFGGDSSMNLCVTLYHFSIENISKRVPVYLLFITNPKDYTSCLFIHVYIKAKSSGLTCSDQCSVWDQWCGWNRPSLTSFP